MSKTKTLKPSRDAKFKGLCHGANERSRTADLFITNRCFALRQTSAADSSRKHKCFHNLYFNTFFSRADDFDMMILPLFKPKVNDFFIIFFQNNFKQIISNPFKSEQSESKYFNLEQVKTNRNKSAQKNLNNF